MKVESYRVHNVLGIKDIQFDLDGYNLFLVGGRNGQGKTSALKAFTLTMCGRRDSDEYPEITLKNGEREGFVEINLVGNVPGVHDTNRLKVKLHLKRHRNGSIIETFTIEDEQGDEAPEPRTLLKKLYSMRGFDPLSFRRLDRAGKLRQLKQLVGLDFTALDQQRQKLYDERTALNRDIKRIEARLQSTPKHEGLSENTPISELLRKLDDQQSQNIDNQKKRDAHARAIANLEGGERKIADTEAQIAKLIDQLKQQQQYVASLREVIAKSEVEVASLQDHDLNAIRGEINNATVNTAKHRENEQRALLEKEILDLESKSEACTNSIEAIDQEKQEAIEQAKWPIEGLSVDSDGVLYNGIPIEQINTAKATLISTEIGIALNPHLRVFVCEGGSDLDQETLNELDRILKEKDFQMIVEVMTRTKEDDATCSVVIKDGEIQQKKTEKIPLGV